MPKFSSFNPFGSEIDYSELSSAAQASLNIPIGSIVGWLKDFTNTPALPDGFVECDGSVLSDADSVYNGQTLPNLNASKFLMGSSASGSTGGVGTRAVATDRAGDTGSDAGGFGFTSSATQDNKPPYYTVVWIMRVK